MKKSDVTKEGKYLYAMPHWNTTTKVEVKKFEGFDDFFVWFSDYQYPVKMRDIPEEAMFFEIKNKSLFGIWKESKQDV